MTRGRTAIAVTLATAVVPALLLTACADTTARTAPPTVGFIGPAAEFNFAKETAAGFRFGVGQVGGVDPVVTGPPVLDPPRQIEMFQELAARNPDGISVQQLSQELFSPELAAAAKKGIPVIAVDNRLGPEARVDLFVGNDNHELGRTLADLAIRQLPEGASGKVVLGTPIPGVSVLDQRAKGMRDEFRERLPGVRVLGPFDTKHDPAANLTSWEALVRANPDALAFLGTGDGDGGSLADIRRSTRGTWLAGAFDLDPRALQAVKDKHVLLVSPEHFLKGAIAGHLQARHAKNDDRLEKGWIYTPGLAVTPANVDEIIARQSSAAATAAWFKPKLEHMLRDLDSYLRPLHQAR
jgi:ribose transport system substrate-binding protein